MKIYHSLIKNVDLVIGNSSSGILEVPSLKKYALIRTTQDKNNIVLENCFNNLKSILYMIKNAIPPIISLIICLLRKKEYSLNLLNARKT